MPNVRTAWQKWSLARRFVILAFCLSVASTLVLGFWISDRISQTARAREAGSAAIYMGHFVSPLIQGLDQTGSLSTDQFAKLDDVVASAALRLRVVAIKIWSLSGTILYSTDRALVGKTFPVANALARAVSGEIASEFDTVSSENTDGASSLIEIYAPVRSDATGNIIAVAEFYEDADDLIAELSNAQFQSWFVTGTVLISLFAAYYAIVSEGSRTIDRQRNELISRIAELAHATEDSRERDIGDIGVRKIIDDNLRLLKMVGWELHDGPAQLISLALLRLDTLAGQTPDEDLVAVRATLKDAIREIRGISAGLPLHSRENMNILDCIKSAIRDHEYRTRTSVVFLFKDLPAYCPSYVTVCLVRVVQEGLSNAFRHADAKNQTVIVEGILDGVRAQISDSGSGIVSEPKLETGSQRGLAGLKARLESVRGTFHISTKAGVGTTLSVWVPLEEGLPNGS
jgi:signal transduction histidine kinase